MQGGCWQFFQKILGVKNICRCRRLPHFWTYIGMRTERFLRKLDIIIDFSRCYCMESLEGKAKVIGEKYVENSSGRVVCAVACN